VALSLFSGAGGLLWRRFIVGLASSEYLEEDMEEKDWFLDNGGSFSDVEGITKRIVDGVLWAGWFSGTGSLTKDELFCVRSGVEGVVFV
jgi:hypothetical protein